MLGVREGSYTDIKTRRVREIRTRQAGASCCSQTSEPGRCVQRKTSHTQLLVRWAAMVAALSRAALQCAHPLIAVAQTRLDGDPLAQDGAAEAHRSAQQSSNGRNLPFWPSTDHVSHPRLPAIRFRACANHARPLVTVRRCRQPTCSSFLRNPQTASPVFRQQRVH